MWENPTPKKDHSGLGKNPKSFKFRKISPSLIGEKKKKIVFEQILHFNRSQKVNIKCLL